MTSPRRFNQMTNSLLLALLYQGVPSGYSVIAFPTKEMQRCQSPKNVFERVEKMARLTQRSKNGAKAKSHTAKSKSASHMTQLSPTPHSPKQNTNNKQINHVRGTSNPRKSIQTTNRGTQRPRPRSQHRLL
jgi:hypothetical protein